MRGAATLDVVGVVADIAEAGDRGVGHHVVARAQDMECRQAAAARRIAARACDGGFGFQRCIATGDGRV